MNNKQNRPTHELESHVDAIERALALARWRLHRHAGTFLFWGLVMMLAGVAHYWIATQGLPGKWIGLSYVILFGGATVGVFIYYALRASSTPAGSQQEAFTRIFFAMLLSANMFAVGFLNSIFAPYTLFIHLTILAIAIAGWAAALRSWPLALGALGINATAYLTLAVSSTYHPLLLALAGLIGLCLPGIWLKMKQEQA